MKISEVMGWSLTEVAHDPADTGHTCGFCGKTQYYAAPGGEVLGGATAVESSHWAGTGYTRVATCEN